MTPRFSRFTGHVKLHLFFFYPFANPLSISVTPNLKKKNQSLWPMYLCYIHLCHYSGSLVAGDCNYHKFGWGLTISRFIYHLPTVLRNKADRTWRGSHGNSLSTLFDSRHVNVGHSIDEEAIRLLFGRQYRPFWCACFTDLGSKSKRRHQSINWPRNPIGGSWQPCRGKRTSSRSWNSCGQLALGRNWNLHHVHYFHHCGRFGQSG